MSDSFQFGRWLSHPPHGEEVVISGISGRFPESDGILQFGDHLFNKRDMVTNDNKRWDTGKTENLLRSGKISGIDKLDAGFFGLHYRQTDMMTPNTRKMLETVVESILDAGVNPRELEGTNTGVFVGICFSDKESAVLRSRKKPQLFAATGYLRSFMADRISYYLKFKGPCCVLDTACASSLTALEQAYKSIRMGKCDNALVAGLNLVLQSGMSLQYFRLGLLSSDGVTKVFDQKADGFVRGETTACFFLQKKKNARRVYAEILYSKISSDGFKSDGITFPSALVQETLMSEVLEDSGINPSEIRFMEAHSTGTEVGDMEEVQAIDCAIAKKRTEPLLVGSVKCSVGHTEAASGVCSLAKVIIAMETGYIAPNIHLKNIKKGMLGFEEDRMKVVTELTKLDRNNAIIGINSFGIGGSNSHVLVKRFEKTKMILNDGIPRLVCVSGRTEEAVSVLLQDLNTRPLDVEYVGLYHHIFNQDIVGHFYRGFTIISKDGPNKTEIRRYFKRKLCLHLIVGKFEKGYKVTVRHLLNFPCFKTILRKINDLVDKKLNDFDTAVNNNNVEVQQNIYALAVQIGIVEILKLLKLDFIIIQNNHFGNLINAYCCEVISLTEVIDTVQKIEVPSVKLFPKSDNSVVLNLSDSIFENSNIITLGRNEDESFLEILGSLYEEGFNPQLQKLYPSVGYPVSRGTPTIAPLIRWDYSKSWKILIDDNKYGDDFTTQHEYTINVNVHEDYGYITGHVIDGRNLIPACECLNLVWKTFLKNYNVLDMDTIPIVFENCKFLRPITIPKNDPIVVLVSIQKSSGKFEIVEKNSLVVAGRIFSPKNIKEHQSGLPDCEIKTDRRDFLDQDEVYRELHLRGYNYSGLFKGIVKCNVDASAALVRWERNYTTFMDKMLQLQIFQMDTRLLHIPISIRKLSINPLQHMIFAKSHEQELCPVYSYKNNNVIRSGGIEITGLKATSISKKKSNSVPTLEKNIFVPNNLQISLEESVRIVVQIILENCLENHFRAVEIPDQNSQILLPFVLKALNDIPSVIVDLTVNSTTPLETVSEIKVENIDLGSMGDVLLIVANRVRERSDSLQEILDILSPKGYVLMKEEIEFNAESLEKHENVKIITEHIIGNKKLVLFKKIMNQKAEFEIVEMVSKNFEWLPQLQKLLKNNKNIVIYSQNVGFEGVLGLTNCLRKEANGNKVRCFFMMDEAPTFDIKNPFYQSQLKKEMAFNVYKDKKWGTYRHLILENLKEIRGDYFFVNNTIKNDLSSLKWLEGFPSMELKKEEHMAFVYYSSLNFKDIMLASGRVNLQLAYRSRIKQEYPQGFEFSGKDIYGRRIMGLIYNAALATRIITNRQMLWEVPDHFSLQDAATVPMVYSTLVYAFFMVMHLKQGMSILIHSATGGIGIAALNICLYYECDIYVTVGTQEKRDYLKMHFPQIPENHIGNSRDTSFEEMIKTQTNNRGVDVVLNSLSEEKLKASIRCVAPGGHFLELGKFDLGNDESLNLLFLERNVSYHGIMYERVMLEGFETKTWIYNKFCEGLKLNYIKPLPKTIFHRDEVVQAYKYMTTGRHIGKVIVQIRDEDNRNVESEIFKGFPRFYCHPEKSYIILGGLGGIGLELADWLYLRGVKNLVLVSRFGIQKGYQKQRIGCWTSSGVTVHISTSDITTKQGCLDLINKTKKLGPIDAIFNLAVVLNDGLFEGQNLETFTATLAPKAQATIYLDQITRELCQDLRYFVVFSSVSCGRGNAGQTNYGMANSITERICERRKEDGFPGLSIQWGAIGEVGLVAKMLKENTELVIGGTHPQKISSCLEVLDKLLKQDNPIVSSMVVAKKTNRGNLSGTESASDIVATILGIKDINIVGLHISFAELGMDSMMGTEVVQTLERDFDIYITSKEIRNMTFAKLMELESQRVGDKTEKVKTEKSTNVFWKSLLREDIKESLMNMPSQVKDTNDAATVFVLPGIDGALENMECLTKNLRFYVLGIQYCCDPTSNLGEFAKNILHLVEDIVCRQGTFYLIGYSFGTVVALELAILLEEKGFTGCILQIDGSPASLSTATRDTLSFDNEANFQILLILKVLFPTFQLEEEKGEFLKCKNFDERIDLALSKISSEFIKNEELSKQTMKILHYRINVLLNYKRNHAKIKSRVHLFKARNSAIENFAHDYQLGELCEQPVRVTVVDGNHLTILNQRQLVQDINEALSA